jgi:hypothetical protein
MRGEGPFVFAQVTNKLGVDEIAVHILKTMRRSTHVSKFGKKV